jgi:DNA-binding NarL/FixJ family response regulator
MARRRWDHPDEHDHVVLLAEDDEAWREAAVAHLERIPGRARAATLGTYPRFRVVATRDGDEALRRATAQVTAAAVDLRMPRRPGIEVIHALRQRRPDAAILAYTAAAPAAEAVAAMMAGADFFHESRDAGLDAFERALELAIDRRRLARIIERNEAEVEAARGKLAQLSKDRDRVLPGFRPPQTREDVIAFRDAARRYLSAAARLHEGDARGLAERLGVSYFALRRLLAKYDVPIPGSRSGGRGTRSR